MLSKFKKQGSKGFTLIEVIVVIALLAILATIVLVAINPAENTKDARNTKRRADVLQILNAVNQYYVKNGVYPTNMPTVLDGAVDVKYSAVTTPGDICDGGAEDLVPTYIAALPFDTGGSYSSCTSYDTKYTIQLLAGNRVKVATTVSEGAGISVTR